MPRRIVGHAMRWYPNAGAGDIVLQYEDGTRDVHRVRSSADFTVVAAILNTNQAYLMDDGALAANLLKQAESTRGPIFQEVSPKLERYDPPWYVVPAGGTKPTWQGPLAIPIKAGDYYEVQMFYDPKSPKGWSHDGGVNWYDAEGMPNGAKHNEAVSGDIVLGAAILSVSPIPSFDVGDLIGGWRKVFDPALQVTKVPAGRAIRDGWLRLAMNDTVQGDGMEGNIGSLLAKVTIRQQ